MNILFLCKGNSARSQIAEGLAKEMLPSSFNVASAGSNPTGYIHEGAKKTMNELGIDISNQYSKSINDLEKGFINNLDFVITLCADEICPNLDTHKNVSRIFWPNPDPVINNISSSHQEKVFSATGENIYKLLKSFFTEFVE